MKKLTLVCLFLLSQSASAETQIHHDSFGNTIYHGDIEGKSHTDTMGYTHYEVNGKRCLEFTDTFGTKHLRCN